MLMLGLSHASPDRPELCRTQMAHNFRSAGKWKNTKTDYWRCKNALVPIVHKNNIIFLPIQLKRVFTCVFTRGGRCLYKRYMGKLLIGWYVRLMHWHPPPSSEWPSDAESNSHSSNICKFDTHRCRGVVDSLNILHFASSEAGKEICSWETRSHCIMPRLGPLYKWCASKQSE